MLLVAAIWIATGVLALRRPAGRTTGTLMIAAGAAWLLPLLASAGAPAAVTAGLLLRYAYVAVVAHLLLAFPGRRRSALVAAGYGLAIGVQGLRLLVTPAADLHTCDGCVEQLLLIEPVPALAEALRLTQALAGIALIASVIAVLARRQRRMSAPRRRVYAPVLGAGAVLALLVAALLGAGILGRPDAKAAIAGALLVAFAAVPCAFLLATAREQVRRAAAHRALALRLEAPLGPGELRAALADALGDPELELADGVGEAGGGWTPITRGGRPVAAIRHDTADDEFVRAVGATAALALENARLGAALVTAAEQERRRIERDLHDGAQRRLAGLALELGMAVEEASPELRDTLVRARSQAVEAQRELRALAHGILPAVLAEQGLTAALQALLDELPLATRYIGPERLGADPVTESSLYFVATEALANVLKHAQAATVTVTVRGAVELEVRDDGVGGATFGHGLLGLRERMCALGGDLELASAGGTILTARVPCER